MSECGCGRGGGGCPQRDAAGPWAYPRVVKDMGRSAPHTAWRPIAALRLAPDVNGPRGRAVAMQSAIFDARPPHALRRDRRAARNAQRWRAAAGPTVLVYSLAARGTPAKPSVRRSAGVTTAARARRTCGGGCVGVRAAARARHRPPCERASARAVCMRVRGWWCARLSVRINARERVKGCGL